MQTYYQFYWNKIDEESIRILRIFGESEDVIVPETIVFMTRRKKSGRRYRQMVQTGTHASWNLAVTG